MNHVQKWLFEGPLGSGDRSEDEGLEGSMSRVATVIKDEVEGFLSMDTMLPPLLNELEDFLSGPRLAESESKREELQRENEALRQQVHTLQALAVELQSEARAPQCHQGDNVSPPPIPYGPPSSTSRSPLGGLPVPNSSLLPVVQITQLKNLQEQVAQLERDLTKSKHELEAKDKALDDRSEEVHSWNTQYVQAIQQQEQSTRLLERLQEENKQLRLLVKGSIDKTDKPQDQIKLPGRVLSRSLDSSVEGGCMDTVYDLSSTQESVGVPPPVSAPHLPSDEEQLLREKISELEQIILQSNLKNNLLQEKLEEERKLHGSTVHQLQAELAELQAALDGVQGSGESLGAVVHQTQGLLTELTAKHEALEKEQDKLKNELSVCSQQRLELETRVKSLEREKQDCEAEIKSTKSKNGLLQLENQQFQEKLEAAQTDLQQKDLDCKASLRTSAQLVKQLQTELKKTSTQLNTLRTAVKARIGDVDAVSEMAGSSVSMEQKASQESYPTEGEAEDDVLPAVDEEIVDRSSLTDRGSLTQRCSEHSDNSKSTQDTNFFQKLFPKRDEEKEVPSANLKTEKGKLKM